MASTIDQDSALADVLQRHQGDPSRLLQILRDVQEVSGGWLPPAVLTRVATGLGLPRARVEGVAGFYSFLYTEPVGRYRILIANNITDQMQGNAALMDQLCRELLLEQGKTSEDGLVSVDYTSCTGLCDQGPGMLVNGWAIPRGGKERVSQIAKLVLEQRPVAQWPVALFKVDDNIRRADVLLKSAIKPGEAIEAALARGGKAKKSQGKGPKAAAAGADALLAEIERANLRGRGGAGFVTAQKLAGCRTAPDPERYVVCNADEGEPGTFKDRVLLTRHADLVFEGMTLSGYVIGAKRGLLYLRGEYRYLREPLEACLARRRQAGVLGKDIRGQAGFDFDIEIHLGAGAYVCGEESALLESLEGKRGIPRNRPPYPTTHGYLGHPTAIDNVETLCALALIAIRGGDWYRAIGTRESAGTKLLSVSGDCVSPGVYEYPFGVTVAEVLEACGAGRTRAVQISGASGVCVDPSEFGRKIGFEDLATAGAFMVFDESRDLFEVARSFTHFFAHESCGFCTPCRVGTTLVRDLMDKLHQGLGSQRDLDQIVALDRLLLDMSHCGLGHTACNPVLDTLKRFRPAYEHRLQSLGFQPAFDLDGALARARRMTGRDDAGAHLSQTDSA